MFSLCIHVSPVREHTQNVCGVGRCSILAAEAKELLRFVYLDSGLGRSETGGAPNAGGPRSRAHLYMGCSSVCHVYVVVSDSLGVLKQ